MNELWLKFWKYFSFVILTAMFGALCQVAYWQFYPYDILQFKEYCYINNKISDYCSETPGFNKFEGIVKNKDKKVKRGDFLRIEIDYNKSHEIPSIEIVRQLVNDRYITLVSEHGNLPCGKHKAEIFIYIPLNIFPGKYKMINTYTYNINPIRIINETWISEWFEVLP